jgi:hypothetical protein
VSFFAHNISLYPYTPIHTHVYLLLTIPVLTTVNLTNFLSLPIIGGFLDVITNLFWWLQYGHVWYRELIMYPVSTRQNCSKWLLTCLYTIPRGPTLGVSVTAAVTAPPVTQR